SEPHLEGVVVKRQVSIYALLILLILLLGTVRADEKKYEGGTLPLPVGPWVQAFNEKREVLHTFVAGDHPKPAPDRVPLMLELLLKERILDHFLTDSSERGFLSHAFGHMARGNPKLIRLYESRFAGGSKTDRAFLLSALRICGDETTRQQLE